MASTLIEQKPRILTPRTRRDEIVAILFLALGLLLTLCLVSAAFFPNDPSWNSAGQTETHNWAGSIGANVSAALFQTIGIASYMLPPLCLAASWRRFRTRTIHAPVNRLLGLTLLVLASAALLSLSHIRPLFDASVQAGGLVGTLIANVLAGGLNTVGATVLLVAIAATGLLLATNFSFIGLYEKLVLAFGDRFAFVRKLPEQFTAWRATRREQARLRKEQRQALKLEQQASRDALKNARDLTPAARVAEFMKHADAPPTIKSTSISGEPDKVPVNSITVAGEQSHTAAAGAAVQAATIVESRSGRRSIFPGLGAKTAVAEDELEVEEMVAGASVLRTKVETPATGKLPFDAERARRVSYTDYSMPPLEFLNEAPPHSEQADNELLGLATRLAEKCKEFNVTGQIKHICPGPVVTTYEFKPDPGVKYSRVVSLVDDLCLALKAESIRIDRMPGKPHVGIEVP